MDETGPASFRCCRASRVVEKSDKMEKLVQDNGVLKSAVRLIDNNNGGFVDDTFCRIMHAKLCCRHPRRISPGTSRTRLCNIGDQDILSRTDDRDARKSLDRVETVGDVLQDRKVCVLETCLLPRTLMGVFHFSSWVTLPYGTVLRNANALEKPVAEVIREGNASKRLADSEQSGSVLFLNSRMVVSRTANKRGSEKRF